MLVDLVSWRANWPETELSSALPITLRIPGLESRAKAGISTLSTTQLNSVLGEIQPLTEMLDRAVALYAESGSFASANYRANSLIIPPSIRIQPRSEYAHH
jgi:hypothetical protein